MADLPISARRRRRAAALLASVAAALALLWGARRPLATWALDRELAAAGVPARYRLVAVSPGEQVVTDVVLGDPAHPDLVARRLVVGWAYGLGGPRLVAVRAEGVRLRASWTGGRLSLGSLDRLLPQSGAGSAALPDLRVALADAAVALRLPAGEVGLRVAGAGNLRDGFRGTLGVRAAALRVGPCVADAVAGEFAVVTAAGRPTLRGPATLGQVACPELGLHAGAGRIDAALAANASLDRATATLAPAGFAAAIGGSSLGPLTGRVTVTAGGEAMAAGRLAAGPLVTPAGRAAVAEVVGRVAWRAGAPIVDAALRVAGATAAAELRRAVAALAPAAAGTPLAPLAARLGAATGALLADADVRVPLQWADGTLRIAHATWRDRAVLDATLRRGGAADVRLAGRDLPALALAARRDAAGWRARLAPTRYAAGDAALALAATEIVARAGAVRVTTAATLDGPLGAGGRIEGLAVPLAGTWARGGEVRIGEGCLPVRATRVALGGARLDDVALRVCGAPILRRDAAGRIRIAASAADIALHGRSGAAPLALGAARLALADGEIVLDGPAIRLGAGDAPTRLQAARVTARPEGGAVGGRFEGLDGALASVPLRVSGGAGAWRLADGALRLGGALVVADSAAPARFRPLASDDVVLTLAGGRVAGTAALHLPGRRERVLDLRLEHDLAAGRGHADLAVPGLAFARGGLQPELLTPLTLGVIADVAGTVRGEGRIDWSAAGTASRGRFATDRLDLAAAFGPVSGLAGTLVLTDLLGLVSAPDQELRIAEVNPGVPVADGVLRYRLLPDQRIAIDAARWPFAGGTLTLAPTTLDLAASAERRLTFAVDGLDAARFLQQLDLPNISATGTFDGRLPMVFDAQGGRIAGGGLASRGTGTLAYVGELTNAQLGTMGKLAFDALKAIRYNRLDIRLDGRLDGEMVSLVRFDGVRQATGERGFVARAIRNLPFRFNIAIRAPFRGLAGTARSYADPRVLLGQGLAPPAAVQPADSGAVR